MSYPVKEIFYSLQGEGARAGRPAVFCRFAGCNLWSGLEKHRADAVCKFCDTQFVGVDGPDGGKFASPEELATTVDEKWPDGSGKYVVCTGGEPLLQLDNELVAALQAKGFEVAIEGLPGDPEQLGGHGLVAVGAAQGLLDQQSLRLANGGQGLVGAEKIG